MWKKNSWEKIIWKWNIVEIIQYEVDINWKNKLFEVARRAPWVRLIIKSEWKFLLTKEFRWEYNDFDYRLPWWKVFDRIDDMNNFEWNIIDAANKSALLEAKQECWIEIKNLELYKISKCWSTIEWDLYYYIVNDFFNNWEQELELWETISIWWYTKEEIIELIKSWKFWEDRSVWVFLPYLLNN